MPSQLIFWFSDITPDDINLVGRKCVSLAEMAKIGVAVPPGFALSKLAWERFILETGVGEKIRRYLSKFSGELRDYKWAEEAGRYIRQMVEAAVMPGDIQKEIIASYERLSELCGIADVPVSVRSSGPVSHPGLFETYLNVRGNSEIIQKVVRCWASVFSPQAIAMRAQKGLAVDSEPIGVGIQRMLKTRSAGVLFSCHPITGDISRAVIESSWGLGTSVVQAMVAPDRFTVNKGTLSIEGRLINRKDRQVLPDKQGIKVKPVPPDKQAQPSLSDDEIVELVRLAKIVEQHYGGVPQNIEWVVADELPFPGNIFLVQARPVVGVGADKSDVTKPKGKGESDHILDLVIKRFYR